MFFETGYQWCLEIEDPKISIHDRKPASKKSQICYFSGGRIRSGESFTCEFSGLFLAESESNPFVFYGIKVPRKALSRDINGALGAFVSISKSQKRG